MLLQFTDNPILPSPSFISNWPEEPYAAFGIDLAPDILGAKVGAEASP